MQTFKQIFKSHYISGTIFYSFPNFFSIIISLISIPVFLNLLSPENFANYLISHFILTIAIITNLNFNRIATINIAKKNSKKHDIIFTSILLTGIFSTILSLLFYYSLIYFINYFDLENIEKLKNIEILFGLIITNFYLTLEGILKGDLNYKSLSILNLLFYSVSLSSPALLVFYQINLEIFTISIFIKLFVVIVMFILIIFKLLQKKISVSKPFINDCKTNLKWMTFNTTLNQIYNYFDKYLIKIFLDNASFVFYNISQQIASKFGSPIMSYNNIFIAKANYNSQNKKKHLSMAGIFYCIYTFFLIFLSYLFLEKILKIWLGDAYSVNYFNLIKIFILISITNAFSNLLIDFFDSNKNSKFNSYVETIILFPFIIGILISIYKTSIYYFIFVILLKELSVLTIRFYKINKLFVYKNLIFFQFFLILINIILWFNNFEIQLIILIQFLHLAFFLPFKKIKKFYRI